MGFALPAPRRVSLFGWLRVTLRLSAMIVLFALCVPFYYLARWTVPRNPVPSLFLAGIGWIAGMRMRSEGQRVRRGAVLIANHVSWLDIPALAATTGSAFVGHDGLASMPVLKWLCAMNNTVFVARHERTSVHSQVELVRAALSDSGALTIFPEGTTSDGTGLLPFKSSLLSAFEPLPTGIAVQPVLLDYGREAAGIAWIGEEHGLDNFLRLLARRRPIDLTVKFMPVLSGPELTNRKIIAAAAREALLRGFGQ
jgi:1-acyl-sn-glycerol-3-phosphate acyltransferase